MERTPFTRNGRRYVLVTGVPSWEERLRHIADRAQVEADAGAPGPMIAIYVRMEVEHLIAGHDGDAMDCDACMATRRERAHA